MKVLVLGYGSIGKRHIRNLLQLGYQNLTVFDPNESSLKEVEGIAPNTDVTSDYGALLMKSFDVVFVCSPTALHVKQALDFAERKTHLFIEKPLGDSLEGVNDLIGTVRKNQLITMIGCNMRFHPAVTFLKEVLHSNILGALYHFRLEAASYLPDWRPGQDYRNNYGAHRDMGGGIILDGIHELDYATWLFGDFRQIECVAGKLSNLEIDVEDVAEITVQSKSNVIGSIYLSYLDQPYRRGYDISGEKGSLRWRYENKFVEIFMNGDTAWKKAKEFSDYDANNSYLDMLKYFFNCLENKRETFCNVKFARNVLSAALTARSKAESKEKQLSGSTQ